MALKMTESTGIYKGMNCKHYHAESGEKKITYFFDETNNVIGHTSAAGTVMYGEMKPEDIFRSESGNGWFTRKRFENKLN